MELDLDTKGVLDAIDFLVGIRNRDNCYGETRTDTLKNALYFLDKIPITDVESAKQKVEIVSSIDFDQGMKLLDNIHEEFKDTMKKIDYLLFKKRLIYGQSEYRITHELLDISKEILKEDPNNIDAKVHLIRDRIDNTWLSDKEQAELSNMNDSIINSPDTSNDEKVDAIRRKLHIEKRKYTNSDGTIKSGKEGELKLITYYTYKQLIELQPNNADVLQVIIENAYNLKLYKECLEYIEKYFDVVAKDREDKKNYHTYGGYSTSTIGDIYLKKRAIEAMGITI